MQKMTIGKIAVRQTCLLFAMTILLLLSGLEHNLNFAAAQQFPGPVSMSLAGAGAAGLGAPEGVLVNPAAVNLQSPLEADIIYQDGDIRHGDRRTGLGLLLIDNSKDVMFPGAIYYTQGARTFQQQRAEEQLWSVVIGKSYSEQLVFGVRLSYLTSTISNDKQHKQLTGAIGGILQIVEGLSVGLSLENLADPDDEIPVAFRLTPETKLGVRLKPGELFGFLLDVSRKEAENPDKKGVIHLGAESFTNAFTVFRLGMKWDGHLGENFFTAGAGFDGPRLKVNYAMQKALKGTNGALHSVDFRVTF